MNKFLFITHLTPERKRSVLRQKLIGIYYNALINQSYSGWKVAVFGEPEFIDERFHYFSLPDVSRSEKPKLISQQLNQPAFKQLADEADYIIKLDDDDLISPVLLHHLRDFSGDLFYDEFHTFTDITSGQVTQQKRDWIASTCVHRKSCALDRWTGAGSSEVGTVLYSDHSKAWHAYYLGKNKVSAERKHPCYLRVLSPTSITSDQRKRGEDDFDIHAYHAYLRKFGEWENAIVPDFENYLQSLSLAWKDSTGKDQVRLPSFRQSSFKRVAARLIKIFRRHE